MKELGVAQRTCEPILSITCGEHNHNKTENKVLNKQTVKLRPAGDWEILNCIKLTQHYKMHQNIFIRA
jgi:hypothetical protein